MKPHAQRINSRPLLAAAVVAVIGLGAASALAQQQVNQGGGALDANNRVGSGGSNVVGGVQAQQRMNNQIVTGNVTGGAGFRDAVPYRAPGEFRDFTAGFSSSAFAGQSTGVTTQGQLINNSQVVRPYYGAAQTVAPPAGYIRAPGTGGYLPPSTFMASDQRLDWRVGPGTGGVSALDSRANLNMNLGSIDLSERQAESAFRSAVATDETMSFAPEALLRPDLAPELRAERGRAVSPYTRLSRDTRMDAFTPDRIGDLRSELLRDVEGRRLGAREIEELLAQRTAARQLNQDLVMSGAQPQDRQMEPGQVDPNARDPNLRSPAEQIAEGSLRLASPAEQSAQYAQLVERLERYEQDPFAEALRPMITRQMEEAEQEQALPGVPSVIQQQMRQLTDGRQPADPPVEVRSLAAGVSSPTLREVYEQAEQFMAEGRYVSAIARYDAAERLVPNQPLTLLGRATAELGAGFYRRAAINLRRAYAENKELTMAQLDLNTLIGPDRLQEVAETLRSRAAADREDVDSLFLLAFISYSTGNYEQASAFLELAHGRSQDPFFAEMRRFWSLQRPEEQPGPGIDQPADQPEDQPPADGQAVGDEPAAAEPPVADPGADEPPVTEPGEPDQR